MAIGRSLTNLKRRIKRAVGIWSIPPLTGVADASWYDTVYRESREYGQPYWYSHYYPLWALIAERVSNAGAKAVLDIGCGPGQLASCLFDLAKITAYTGLDFSAETIAIARRACPRGSFIVGDALTSTVYDTTDASLTICTEVLEHIPNDLVLMDRLRGRCICTVPNFSYVSHVRYFSSEEDVATRYGKFFDHYSIQPIRAWQSPNNMYFVLDGVRSPGDRG